MTSTRPRQEKAPAHRPQAPTAKMSRTTDALTPLTADQVRDACTAPATKKAYKSNMNQIGLWIRETQAEPERFFDEQGTVDVTVFTPDLFELFLLAKLNSKAVKVKTLSGYRSAMRDMYRRKRLPLPPQYHEDMKTFFSGMKRTEADDDQGGASTTKPGKEPLAYSLYEKLCARTLVLTDNGFAHLFLTTQWNLMCRSNSVETLHMSHLHSADDSVGCVLHKTKTNQEASGPKDPRHLYANPLRPDTCWVLALAIYLASNPSLPHGRLFPGADQKGWFSKSLSTVLKQITAEKVYGTHSIRKGVATFSCGTSTGGPSIVSVCLRCGWSLGGVQDRYFRYEAAGDQFLGRVVAGLPINSADFGLHPPHFADPDAEFISTTLSRTFPTLSGDAQLRPILLLCLASLSYHAKYLLDQLPASHPLRANFLFCDPTALSISKMHLLAGDQSWMRTTGIPPHVELYKQQQKIQNAVEQLPTLLLGGFEKLLEERGVSGGGITRQDLRGAIQGLLEDAGLLRTATVPDASQRVQEPATTAHLWKEDGKFHRLPEDFVFPDVDAFGAWRMWWFGNPAKGYPPFKRLQPTDFRKPLRKTYSEWSVLMNHLISALERSDAVVKEPGDETEAHALYVVAMANVPIKPCKNHHKSRTDRAMTTLRRIREAIHESNPNARTLPFRKRKRQRL